MFEKIIRIKNIIRSICLIFLCMLASSAYGVTCPVGTPCSLSTLAAGTIRMNPSAVPYFSFKTVADIDTQIATYPYYRIKYRYNVTNWAYITGCSARLATNATLARNTLDRVGYTTRLTTELSPAMGTTYAHKQIVTAYGFTNTPTTTGTHALTIWMDFFSDSGCATAAGLTSAGATGNFIVANNCTANVDASTNTSWAQVIGGATETLGTNGHVCSSGTASGTITRACSVTGVWGAVSGGSCVANCTATTDATTNTSWVLTTGGTTATIGSGGNACTAGYYVLSGSVTRSCSIAGAWGAISGQCIKNCTASSDATTLTSWAITTGGTTATVGSGGNTCSSGAACTPSPTRACSIDGAWGAVSSKCAVSATCAASTNGTSCGFPSTVNNGCAGGISVNSNTGVNCFIGGNPFTPGTWQGTSTCNTNGTWSGTTCTCQ